MSLTSRGFNNRLLCDMSDGDFKLIRPALVPVDLPVRHSIDQPHQTIKQVCFPESGVISVVARAAKGKGVEVGLIGREGMTGTALVLGEERQRWDVYVQIAGTGNQLASDALRLAMNKSKTLRLFLLPSVNAFLTQAMLTALANARYRIDERLARWLLMAQDRVGNVIPLTHEFLGLMLGVRRAGVTNALQVLEGQRLIKAKRREITVLSRKGLEELAGDSYSPDDRANVG